MPAARDPDSGAPGRALALLALTALAGGVLSRFITLPTAGALPVALGGLGFAVLLMQGRRPALLVALAAWGGAAVGVDRADVAVAGIAVGACVLQWWLGAALLRWRTSGPLTLHEPREVLQFALSAAAASLPAAVATLAAQAWVQHDPFDAFDLLACWVTLTAGLCCLAPIVLALIGRPRAAWRARRINTALPLAAALALLGWMIAGVQRVDDEHQRIVFNGDVATASSILNLELHEPLRALAAMRSVFTTSPWPSREAARRAMTPWLEGPGQIQSLGFNRRVALQDIPAFEATVRAGGLPGFRVFDRDESNTRRLPPQGEVYAITYMEPAERSASRLGLNSASIRAAGAAIEQTVRTGEPAATPVFKLTQATDAQQQFGVVAYQAVYQGDPVSETQRRRDAIGVALATVRLDRMLERTLARLPATVRVCIVDTTPPGPAQRLAGAEGCELREARAGGRTEPIDFAGRAWALRVEPAAAHAGAAAPAAGQGDLFAVAGLVAVSLLAASLLIASGRALRIEAAVEEARRARAAADAANAAKSEFLANMSHEIRTPMNAILGMAHLALSSGLTQRQHNYVAKAERAARSLLGVLNDVLDFSKIEAGKLTIEHTPFALSGVLDTLADLVGLRAQDKGLELLFAPAPGLPDRLVGDPLRLSQVLTNLLSNAVKFTERGEVVVTIDPCERDAASVVLRFAVRDTGVGIDPAQRDRLFLPFVQADGSTSRRYGGTGLGLAISRHLIELMGGRLRLDSAPGQGATFSFRLRLGLQVEDDATPPPAEAGWTPAGLRLLIVDDNAAACEIAAGMAQEIGVGEVVKAGDVDTALRRSAEAIAGGRPFDIVLVDWRMPGRDGIDGVRSLMALHDGRPTAILMTTAFGREELLERLAEEQLPPMAVLLKPVMPSALQDALAQASGQRAPQAPPPDDPEAMLAEARRQLQGMRVLLVEDNDINAELAADLLQRVGIEVTLALDGQKALAALAQVPVDAVLMDCQMPVMDGYQATRAIRADERLRHLPIIAMTANAMQGDREEVLQAGMDDHIAKPIEVQDLFDALVRWRAGRQA